MQTVLALSRALCLLALSASLSPHTRYFFLRLIIHHLKGLAAPVLKTTTVPHLYPLHAISSACYALYMVHLVNFYLSSKPSSEVTPLGSISSPFTELLIPFLVLLPFLISTSGSALITSAANQLPRSSSGQWVQGFSTRQPLHKRVWVTPCFRAAPKHPSLVGQDCGYCIPQGFTSTVAGRTKAIFPASNASMVTFVWLQAAY